LSRKRDQSPGSENKPDVELRPVVGGEIDCNKRTKARLDIGEEKGKPVEAAPTVGRTGAGRRGEQRSPRRKRRNSIAAGAEWPAAKL